MFLKLASLISSSILSFNFFSYRDTQDSQRSIPAWSSRREQRPGEMIVRRRFFFLPPVVRSYLFCSLRHDSNGLCRELATMSFASCTHLLQNKLQVLYSSLLVRRGRQEFTIDEICRNFSRLLADLGLLDHSSEECFPLLRPLLGILSLAREFLRTSKAFHNDEILSVFPKLGCGKIVDCLYCLCKSKSRSNLSSECKIALVEVV